MNALRNGFGGRTKGMAVPALKDGYWQRFDFLDFANLTINTAGTGAHTVFGVAGHPGVSHSTVQAVATPDRVCGSFSGISTPYVLGAGKQSIEWVIRIPTVSDGVNNVTVRFGLADSFNIPTDLASGVYFENDFANHGNSLHWFLKCANASARTQLDSGKSPASNVWTRLRLEMNVAGDTLAGFVDDVPIGTVNGANIPTGIQLLLGWQVVKQLGAAQLAVQIDVVEPLGTFSSKR